MKLTPLDIRQKKFQTKFRGLDKEEVSAFLVSLSKEWEIIVDEKKILEIKLNTKKVELERLQRVEQTLFKTLQTAEETGKTLIEQANREAEITLQEKKMIANRIVHEAKEKATQMMSHARTLSKTHLEGSVLELGTLQQELLKLKDEYNNTLESLNTLVHHVKENLENKRKSFHSKNIDELLRNSKVILNNLRVKIDDFSEDVNLTPHESVPQEEVPLENVTENFSSSPTPSPDLTTDPDEISQIQNDEPLTHNGDKQIIWEEGKEIVVNERHQEPDSSTTIADNGDTLEDNPKEDNLKEDNLKKENLSFFDEV